MNDEEVKTIVPREVLVKQGTAAVTCLAGAGFLMLMAFCARLPVLGIILSAAAIVLGIAALMSRNRDDKRPGLVLSAAGVMGFIIRFGIPILRPFAGFALGLGALGLLAAGIIKGIVFLMGLNSRR